MRQELLGATRGVPKIEVLMEFQHWKMCDKQLNIIAKQSQKHYSRSKFCSCTTFSCEWWIGKLLLRERGTRTLKRVNARDKAEAFAKTFSQKCQVDDSS